MQYELKSQYLFIIFIAVSAVYSVDPPDCKCSCKETEMFCTNDDNCTIECDTRCTGRAAHNLDKFGNCEDGINCTCQIEPLDEPVCAENRFNETEMEFKNFHHLHCINLCYRNEFEFKRKSHCRRKRKKPSTSKPKMNMKDYETYLKLRDQHRDMQYFMY